MYDAISDPYCYPGTTVLKNIPDLRNQASLDDFEAARTAIRSEQPLPAGRLSVTQYRAIHKHLFRDIYPWAGQFRTVRISKDGSDFCYPEHIATEMSRLFGELREQHFLRDLLATDFSIQAAHFLSTLNAIHPFREGNGRTQLVFLALLARQAGHPLNLDRLAPKPFLAAMIASFKGNESLLIAELDKLIG